MRSMSSQSDNIWLTLCSGFKVWYLSLWGRLFIEKLSSSAGHTVDSSLIVWAKARLIRNGNFASDQTGHSLAMMLAEWCPTAFRLYLEPVRRRTVLKPSETASDSCLIDQLKWQIVFVVLLFIFQHCNATAVWKREIKLFTHIICFNSFIIVLISFISFISLESSIAYLPNKISLTRSINAIPCL